MLAKKTGKIAEQNDYMESNNIDLLGGLMHKHARVSSILNGLVLKCRALSPTILRWPLQTLFRLGFFFFFPEPGDGEGGNTIKEN